MKENVGINVSSVVTVSSMSYTSFTVNKTPIVNVKFLLAIIFLGRHTTK